MVQPTLQVMDGGKLELPCPKALNDEIEVNSDITNILDKIKDPTST